VQSTLSKERQNILSVLVLLAVMRVVIFMRMQRASLFGSLAEIQNNLYEQKVSSPMFQDKFEECYGKWKVAKRLANQP